MEGPRRWEDFRRWEEGGKVEAVLRIIRYQLQWELAKALLSTWTLQAVSRVRRAGKLLILKEEIGGEEEPSPRSGTNMLTLA